MDVVNYNNLEERFLAMEKVNYLDLKGKVVIVTGSSRGIGRACALLLAEHGARVFLNGRNEEVLQQTVADFNGRGLAVDGIAGDVSDEHFTQQFISDVFDKMGRIDILINNVGGTDRRMLEDTDALLLEKEMSVNLKSAFFMSRAVLPVMKKQGGGKILNIASTAGISGRIGGAHYVAAKSGLIGLTRALAQELGKYSITVNAIAPGLTSTDRTRRLYQQDVFERVAKNTPLGRTGEAEDTAKVALFLVSPLSDFISGQVISVDGGATHEVI